jgi:hypothetical protein
MDKFFIRDLSLRSIIYFLCQTNYLV